MCAGALVNARLRRLTSAATIPRPAPCGRSSACSTIRASITGSRWSPACSRPRAPRCCAGSSRACGSLSLGARPDVTPLRTTSHAPLVLVVPGLGGSGPDHWQTRWESLHPRHARVQQSDWCLPAEGGLAFQPGARNRRRPVSRWSSSPTVSAARSLVHLARRSPALPVRGALLVAPADVDSLTHTPAGNPLLRSDAGSIALPYPATVVVSRNDPFVSFERKAAFSPMPGARSSSMSVLSDTSTLPRGSVIGRPGRDCLERLLARAPTLEA